MNTAEIELPTEYLPNGTKVVSTNDAEPGVIMNGFEYTDDGIWTAYEVETKYGIEVWQRSEFLTVSEIDCINKASNEE